MVIFDFSVYVDQFCNYRISKVNLFTISFSKKIAFLFAVLVGHGHSKTNELFLRF